MGKIPQWWNLNHFDAIMDVHFTDGSKYKDILKASSSISFEEVSLTSRGLFFIACGVCSPQYPSRRQTSPGSPVTAVSPQICGYRCILVSRGAHRWNYCIWMRRAQHIWRAYKGPWSATIYIHQLKNGNTSSFWQQYIAEAQKHEDPFFADKNWNFIKLHYLTHAFDVETKGVTRNYNTKPNKKLHGPLKNAYQDCTNFKNVTLQMSGRQSNNQ